MVEPITTANVGQPVFPTTKGVDPGILMMVVSMMHMDAAHESAKAKLGNLNETFATLSKVAPLANKVSEARGEVTQSELQSSAGELALTNEFQSRYVDNATISQADNNRFGQQQQWAAERGIELEDATKIIEEQIEVEVEKEIQVTDPDTGEVTTQTVTETETRTIEREVADLEAIARNEAKIEAYQNELNAGTADNAVLRQLIADHPEIQSVEATLNELGHSLELTTLGNLGSAVTELSNWTSHLATQVQEFLASARSVHDHLTQLSATWDPHLKEVEETKTKELGHESAYSAMEEAAMKMFSNKAESMPEYLHALGEAIHETEQFLTELGFAHYSG